MKNYLTILVILSLAACTFNLSSEGSPSADSKGASDINQTRMSLSTPANAAFISFIINVHDWVNIDESAATLMRLVDLFERYHVRGDFYFTAPEVEALVNSHPQVIARLKSSDMTISYHVRPPHPLINGFGSHLQELSDQELQDTLLDYETYKLDMTTAELDRSQPGGYQYVAQVFGKKPVTASVPSSDHRIKTTAEKIYARLGARVTVHNHEEGTDIDQPFQYSNGLLIRPSDFSITRIPDSSNFWWNFMSGPKAAEFDPLRMLQDHLAAWQESRPPLITALIHENNFYRSGPEAWTAYYYDHQDKSKPLSPPFNLNLKGQSAPRSRPEQEVIWQVYERLVAYAAQYLNVITSVDLLNLSKGEFK